MLHDLNGDGLVVGDYYLTYGPAGGFAAWLWSNLEVHIPIVVKVFFSYLWVILINSPTYFALLHGCIKASWATNCTTIQGSTNILSTSHFDLQWARFLFFERGGWQQNGTFFQECNLTAL